jgi:DNA polymerase III gamma/tau subunit
MTGIRRTGKTTTARMLPGHELRIDGMAARRPNRWPAFLKETASRSLEEGVMDVMEMNATSRTGRW